MKLPFIERLIYKCNAILLGGGVIFTFYRALGYDIGNSMVEDEYIKLAGKLMKQAEERARRRPRGQVRDRCQRSFCEVGQDIR